MSTKTNRNRIIKHSQFLLGHEFKKLHAPLYFYALKFINDKETAKDMVQDAFLNMLSLRYENEIKNVKAYLFKAVRNNCLNHLKHAEIKSEYAKQELERKEREIKFFDSHKTLIENEKHQYLMDVIRELPEKYKVPFELSRFEELKNKEIAERLNLPVRTVETRIYRALKLLKEKLNIGNMIFFGLSILK